MWQVLAVVGAISAAACFVAMVWIAALYDRARRGLLDGYRRSAPLPWREDVG